jgi:hypothetical protein
MARYGRLALTVACIVLSVAALSNVFVANDEVLAQAKEVGCGREPCSLGSMERTPFAQTFELRTKAATVTVRCARSAVFFGAYACGKR